MSYNQAMARKLPLKKYTNYNYYSQKINGGPRHPKSKGSVERSNAVLIKDKIYDLDA